MRAEEAIGTLKAMFEPLGPVLTELGMYLDNNLFHEFTVALSKLYNQSPLDFDWSLFVAQVVLPIIRDLDAQRICHLVCRVALRAPSEKGVAWLESLAESHMKNDEIAVIMFNAAMAACSAVCGSLQPRAALATIMTCDKKAVGHDDALSVVNASFYAVYRLLSDFEGIYRCGTHFAAHCRTGLPLTADEAADIGRNVICAAFVASDVYVTPELLERPLVANALEKEPVLANIARSLTTGDVPLAVSLMSSDEGRSVFSTTEMCESAVEKARFGAVQDLFVGLPANCRTVPYADIATAAAVPEEDVDRLLLRGLSRNLLEGSIDGAEKTFTLLGMQPRRALSSDATRRLADRLGSWMSAVTAADTALSMLEASGLSKMSD